MNDKQLKEDLLAAGWTCSIRTRKLAGGPTKYFAVKALNEDSTAIKHTQARDVIATHYPGVHLTSGSYISREFTFVEIWR